MDCSICRTRCSTTSSSPARYLSEIFDRLELVSFDSTDNGCRRTSSSARLDSIVSRLTWLVLHGSSPLHIDHQCREDDPRTCSRSRPLQSAGRRTFTDFDLPLHEDIDELRDVSSHRSHIARSVQQYLCDGRIHCLSCPKRNH